MCILFAVINFMVDKKKTCFKYVTDVKCFRWHEMSEMQACASVVSSLLLLFRGTIVAFI